MREDDGGAVSGLDDFRHRECLDGAGDAEQNLVLCSVVGAAEEAFDCGFLIAFRGVGDADLELHSFSGKRSANPMVFKRAGGCLT